MKHTLVHDETFAVELHTHEFSIVLDNDLPIVFFNVTESRYPKGTGVSWGIEGEGDVVKEACALLGLGKGAGKQELIQACIDLLDKDGTNDGVS